MRAGEATLSLLHGVLNAVNVEIAFELLVHANPQRYSILRPPKPSRRSPRWDVDRAVAMLEGHYRRGFGV